MTEKQVIRYLTLIDRRLQIILSGIHWKPEYDREMRQIDQELAELRPLVDAEHQKNGSRADGADHGRTD